MAHASAAVEYRSNQCFIPLGTGARERCMRPDRIRHFGITSNGALAPATAEARLSNACRLVSAPSTSCSGRADV
jgi:hypothetical protein